MIVNVDVTVFYKGYHGDCSEMFLVGNVDQAGKDLVKVNYRPVLVSNMSIVCVRVLLRPLWFPAPALERAVTCFRTTMVLVFGRTTRRCKTRGDFCLAQGARMVCAIPSHLLFSGFLPRRDTLVGWVVGILYAAITFE